MKGVVFYLKINKLTLLLTVMTLITSNFSSIVNADAIADLKEQETQAQTKAEKIDNEINTTLVEVNEKYAVLDDLEQKISKSEQTIKETEESIEQTKVTIEKRKGTVAKRMQSMQLNGGQMSSFDAVLSADNFSDFISRIYAVTVIQGAENSKVTALVAEQEKLEKLETTLATTQADLKSQEQSVKTEKQSLDQKVASLQVTYDENKELLTNLATKRAAEEATKKAKEEADKKAAADKLAKEKADIAKKEQETQKQSQSQSKDSTEPESTQNNSSNNQSTDNNTTESTKPEESSKEPETSESTPEPTPEPEKPSTSGDTLGEATAYLATGNLTATGTVPTPGRTIAVDPSVIPLGSLVKITVPSMPQYSGIYRAEDTGGAVRGNIIDIFFANQKDATNFGRRAIYFSIM